MADTTEKKSSNGNGIIWKQIIIGIFTILLSVVGSVWTSGESSGVNKEKIAQLEAWKANMETKYNTDHDLLIYIKGKVDNIDERLTQWDEEKNLK